MFRDFLLVSVLTSISPTYPINFIPVSKIPAQPHAKHEFGQDVFAALHEVQPRLVSLVEVVVADTIVRTSKSSTSLQNGTRIFEKAAKVFFSTKSTTFYLFALPFSGEKLSIIIQCSVNVKCLYK